MRLHKMLRGWVSLASLALVASTASAGCGDDDDDVGGTAGTVGTAGSTAGAGVGGSAGSVANGTADGNGAPQFQLNDLEIAAVLMAANTGEVEQGQLALERSDDDNVEDFAEQMVSEHGAANERIEAALQNRMIGAMENALSEQLTDEAMQVLRMLEETPEDEFDVAYMESQVQAHARVLDIIDSELLPQAMDPTLRAELENERASAAAHFQQAQNLAGGLEEEP
jgi:putative membrane protein